MLKFSALSKKTRFWLKCCAVVLLLVLIGWWRQPASYRQVGIYPTASRLLIPCDAGFLTQVKRDTFAMRDWQGRLCWQVSAAAADQRGWPGQLIANLFDGPDFSVSPDGHLFAVAMPGGPGVIHAQIWRDGQLLGEHRLSLAPAVLPASAPPRCRRHFRLRACNNGRVLLALSDAGRQATNRNNRWPITGAMYLLDGQRLLARGPFQYEEVFTPDGGHAVYPAGKGVQYADLVAKDGRLFEVPRCMIPTPVSCLREYIEGSGVPLSLFSDGTVLADNGAVYRAGGQVCAGIGGSYISTSSGGHYAVQCPRNFAMRIYSPVSGDTWQMQIHMGEAGVDVSDNGRYLLVCVFPQVPEALRSLAVLLRPLAHRRLLRLYERPGRLRAQIVLHGGQEGPELAGYPVCSWWPSPDGRALVVSAESEGGQGGKVGLYRW